MQQVDTGFDSITLPEEHRLVTGDRVTYLAGGNPPIGGLVDGHDYAAVVITPTRVRLGETFAADNVDPAFDTIRFNNAHGLTTGQRILYGNDGNPSIGGLQNQHGYFVRVLDARTIKLYATKAEAEAASRTFSAFAVDSANDQISLTGHGFAQNQALTYEAPAATTFSPLAVEATAPDDTIVIHNHGFFTGRHVSYRASGGPVRFTPVWTSTARTRSSGKVQAARLRASSCPWSGRS